MTHTISERKRLAILTGEDDLPIRVSVLDSEQGTPNVVARLENVSLGLALFPEAVRQNPTRLVILCHKARIIRRSDRD